MKKHFPLLFLCISLLLLTSCGGDNSKRYDLVPVSEEELESEQSSESSGEVKKEVKEVTVKENTSYNTVEEDSDNLQAGERVVMNPGKKGLSEITYKIIYEDGVEVNRMPIRERILESPEDRLIYVGTGKNLAPQPTSPAPQEIAPQAPVEQSVPTEYDPAPEESKLPLESSTPEESEAPPQEEEPKPAIAPDSSPAGTEEEMSQESSEDQPKEEINPDAGKSSEIPPAPAIAPEGDE